MAICEGMKLSGRGTTGYALLRAGCGAVYGYSQSVTFVGDYKFEEIFLERYQMKKELLPKHTQQWLTYGVPLILTVMHGPLS